MLSSIAFALFAFFTWPAEAGWTPVRLEKRFYDAYCELWLTQLTGSSLEAAPNVRVRVRGLGTAVENPEHHDWTWGTWEGELVSLPESLAHLRDFDRRIEAGARYVFGPEASAEFWSRRRPVPTRRGQSVVIRLPGGDLRFLNAADLKELYVETPDDPAPAPQGQ